MGCLQIDKVDFSREAVRYNGKTYKYVLSVMDVFSRYVWFRALPKKSSQLVSQELKQIFEEYGFPSIVQHDRGTEFEGNVVALFRKHNITNIRSSPYYPQSQGKVEKCHQSMKKKIMYDLRRNTKSGVNWAGNLNSYQFLMNDHPKKVLGWKSPFTVFFSRFKDGKVNQNCRSELSNLWEEVNRNRILYSEKTRKMQEKTLKTPQYLVGDKVFVRIRSKNSRVSNKLKAVKARIEECNRERYQYRCSSCEGENSRWILACLITDL